MSTIRRDDTDLNSLLFEWSSAGGTVDDSASPVIVIFDHSMGATLSGAYEAYAQALAARDGAINFPIPLFVTMRPGVRAESGWSIPSQFVLSVFELTNLNRRRRELAKLYPDGLSEEELTSFVYGPVRLWNESLQRIGRIFCCDSDINQMLSGQVPSVTLATFDDSYDSQRAPPIVGILRTVGPRIATVTEQRQALRLWREGIRRFILVPMHEEPPVAQDPIPVLHRQIFEELSAVASEEFLRSGTLSERLAALFRSDACWAEKRLAEISEATVFSEWFITPSGHGNRGDITNWLLAPARLLAGIGRNHANDLLASDTAASTELKAILAVFKEQTRFVRNTRLFGVRGDEFAHVIKPVFEWSQDRVLSESECECIMALFTWYRVAAGITAPTATAKGAPLPARPLGTLESAALRILVVDDHAAAWRPLFAALHQRAQVNLRIEFIVQSGQEFWSRLSSYDVVLLDVFIGMDDGTAILKRLRESHAYIPVLLWTSSRSVEVASQAMQANGVILKKTVLIDDLGSAVTRWAREGRARKSFSLPNPTFDHIVRRHDLREIAQQFNYWALRHLDSFHGLDSNYFRFFTDHGGRHILKLLELLEDVLRAQINNPKLFSVENRKEREFEVFALYLTVLCHEFGMFPLRAEEPPELTNHRGMGEKESLTKVAEEVRAYQHTMRDLHAVRGMLLLTNKPSEGADYWPDDKGSFIARELDRIASPWPLRQVVAVMTGYHARLFSSLAAPAFLLWPNPDPKKCIKAQEAVKKFAWKDTRFPFDKYKTSLAALSLEFETRPELKERLRRWCAIFRVIDAIDLDHTRNPSAHILEDATSPPAQDKENLKRDVCRLVQCSGGEICIQIGIAPPPAEFVLALMQDDMIRTQAACTQSLDIDSIRAIIESPWSDGSRMHESILELGRCIEIWLLDIWEICNGNIGKNGSQEFMRKERACEILRGQNVRDTEYSFCAGFGSLVASATAFVVAAEVLDEYSAIIETELTDVIKLGHFVYDPRGSPAVLATLNMASRSSKYKDADAHLTGFLVKPQEPPIKSAKYEFKFILPSHGIGGAAFDLVRTCGEFGRFTNLACVESDIVDSYYENRDAFLEDSLENNGTCIRLRTINGVCFLETKETVASDNDYLHYSRRALPGGPTLPTNLTALAIVYNRRITLSVGRSKTSEPEAWINMDTYAVCLPEQSPSQDDYRHYEIELFSDDARILMDLSEVMIQSFRLIQVKDGKLQRAMPGLISRNIIEALWLDMDTGVDDAMALLLALRAPERCRIVAISAVGGNVPVDQVVINSQKVIHYAAPALELPVFRGVDHHTGAADASNVHGSDGIGDIAHHVPAFKAWPTKDLVTGFQETIARLASSTVTFVATGPLTNLAFLIKECPDAVRKLRRLVIMGGAFEEPGNRAALAEFNIHADPDSARQVLEFFRENAIEHTFVPLDVTHRVVLKRDLVDEKSEKGGDASFIKDLAKAYMGFYDKNQAMDGCPMHDPMAVGYVLWPELFVCEKYHVEIAGREAGPAFAGTTSADLRPTRLYKDQKKEVTGIVVQVDQVRFLQKIEAYLLKSAAAPAIGK